MNKFIYIFPVIILFFDALFSQGSRNILFDENIWRSEEWTPLHNPFDNSDMLMSRYGGSEIRFAIRESKKLVIRATSSNHAFDQGIAVYVDGKHFEIETPDIDEKILDIDLSTFSAGDKREVIIRHHCAGSTHPCDTTLKEITVDSGAIITKPVTYPDRTIAFFGDSISVGFSEENYTYKVAERMKMLLHNASIFGSRVGHNEIWDSASDRMHKDIIGFQPDVVVIALGTNDLSDNTSLDDFRLSYTKLITAIRDGTPKSRVITLGLFRRRQIQPSRIRQYSEIVKSIAENNNVQFIDPYDWLNDPDLMDNVHPSKKSQKILADRMYETISDIIQK